MGRTFNACRQDDQLGRCNDFVTMAGRFGPLMQLRAERWQATLEPWRRDAVCWDCFRSAGSY